MVFDQAPAESRHQALQQARMLGFFGDKKFQSVTIGHIVRKLRGGFPEKVLASSAFAALEMGERTGQTGAQFHREWTWCRPIGRDEIAGVLLEIAQPG